MIIRLIALLGAIAAGVMPVYAETDSCTLATAGSTAATATVMPCSNGTVTSSTTDQGVRLRQMTADKTASVTNSTANRIKVYPPSGVALNGLTADLPVTVQPNSRAAFLSRTSTFWHAQYVPSTFTDLTLTGSLTSPSNITATNVGAVTTAGTEVAVESGDGNEHVTRIAMTAFVIGTSADNASLAIGAKFYTWPATANVMVLDASIAGGVTCAISVTTNTPELGIGSVIASGANATLTTGTWENLVDGGASGSSVDAAAVAPDVAGTAFYKKSLTTVTPIIKASGGAARDLFLNAAAAWADVAAAGACTFTGNVELHWRVL